MDQVKDIDDVVIATKFLKLRNSALKRNKEFNLTLAVVKKLISTKRCHYTNVEIKSYILDPNDEIPPNHLTIDRIDNDKGYIIGNVVACSHSFNQIKGDLSVKHIELMYKGLKKSKIL